MNLSSRRKSQVEEATKRLSLGVCVCVCVLSEVAGNVFFEKVSPEQRLRETREQCESGTRAREGHGSACDSSET